MKIVEWPSRAVSCSKAFDELQIWNRSQIFYQWICDRNRFFDDLLWLGIAWIKILFLDRRMSNCGIKKQQHCPHTNIDAKASCSANIPSSKIRRSKLLKEKIDRLCGTHHCTLIPVSG